MSGFRVGKFVVLTEVLSDDWELKMFLKSQLECIPLYVTYLSD